MATLSPAESRARDKWNAMHPNLAWEQLTAGQRQAYTLAEDKLEPDSIPALRAALREARVQGLILERKLTAANEKIRRYEASRELAAMLAADNDAVCP